jgi:hypothetical protein
MDHKAAEGLAHYLQEREGVITHRVAARMLELYPELTSVLRLEEDYAVVDRLAEVSVERLNRLVRAMLLFEAPTLAEPELRWARDVLQRWGVTSQHTAGLIDCYFADLEQSGIDVPQVKLARQLHRFLLTQLDRLSPAT